MWRSFNCYTMRLFSQFNLNCPEPFVALPLNTTTPDPFGSKSMSPLLVVTMSCPFTSNAPPNCGLVSSTTLDIPPPALPSNAVKSTLPDCPDKLITLPGQC